MSRKKYRHAFSRTGKNFELLAENAELAKCLIGKNGDAAFVDKLKNVLKEKCFSEVNKILKTDDEAKFSLLLSIYSFGVHRHFLHMVK